MNSNMNNHVRQSFELEKEAALGTLKYQLKPTRYYN